MKWPWKKSNKAPRRVMAITDAKARQEYHQPFTTARMYLTPTQDPESFRALRQCLPILDTAIDKLVMLTGNAIVTWESERIQEQWDEWAKMVRVAPLSRGLSNIIGGHQGRALLYGTAAVELVLDPGGRDVYGFQHVPSTTIRLREDPNNLLDVIVAQQQQGKPEPVELPREFVHVTAHEPEDSSPYGQSLFAHCPFIADLLVEMAHAEKQKWIRLGSPSHAILVEVPEELDAAIDVQEMVTTLLDSMEEDWKDAMTSRQQGGPIKDFFGAGKISIVTVGADIKELTFDVPWRAALEQIISVTHLPPWMLGMHWSTTERLSEEQAQALEDIILDYQDEYEHMVTWIVDWWARVRGFGTAAREISWPQLSVRDKVELARADLFSAQAVAKREETARKLWDTGVYDQQRYADAVLNEEAVEIATEMAEPPAPAPSIADAGNIALAAGHVHSSSCGCEGLIKNDDAPASIGTGEQPNDQRIADAARDFHADIRASVQEFAADVWEVLRLPEVTLDAAEDTFAYTAEQEAAFDRAVDIFLERMTGRDRTRLGFASAETNDGVIQQWERFGYGLGAGRVSEMTGVEATLALPGRNTDGIRQLLTNAFDRLSEGGHLRLEGRLQELKDLMAEGMQLGDNPITVARRMRRKFDDLEGWYAERLARTEIAFAQNAGMVAEMTAEGVDMSRVDPEAFPAHPHCMCSYTIEQDADTGRWYAAYDISVTACPMCQAYATRPQ